MRLATDTHVTATDNINQRLLLVLLHDRFGGLIHGNCAFVVTLGFNLRNHWALALTSYTTINMLMTRNSACMAMAFVSARWCLIMAMLTSSRCSNSRYNGRRLNNRCSLLSSLLAHTTHLLATCRKHSSNNQCCECQLRFDFHRLSLFHCLRKTHKV